MEVCFTFFKKVNQQETPHIFYHPQFSKQSVSSQGLRMQKCFLHLRIQLLKGNGLKGNKRI